MAALDEHELIARYFRPLATDPAAIGLLDDAALLRPPSGHDLVLTKDGIVEGVHFPPGERGEAVAQKALRVNLSDLASMGAEPLGYLVLLGLPSDWTQEWVSSFAKGLASDQQKYRVALYGGDTIRTPALTVGVTAIGKVPEGRAIRRSGARAGDLLFVSGTIGDGALGLRAMQEELSGLSPQMREMLIARYRRPQPRCALARPLRAHAKAAIDVSDGLAGDLDKLCAASQVSARIDVEQVPLSEEARAAIGEDAQLLDVCLTGGDDYEILCAVDPAEADAFGAASAEAGIPVTAIGSILAEPGAAKFLHADGNSRRFSRRAYSHTG